MLFQENVFEARLPGTSTTSLSCSTSSTPTCNLGYSFVQQALIAMDQLLLPPKRASSFTTLTEDQVFFDELSHTFFTSSRWKSQGGKFWTPWGRRQRLCRPVSTRRCGGDGWMAHGEERALEECPFNIFYGRLPRMPSCGGCSTSTLNFTYTGSLGQKDQGWGWAINPHPRLGHRAWTRPRFQVLRDERVIREGGGRVNRWMGRCYAESRYRTEPVSSDLFSCLTSRGFISFLWLLMSDRRIDVKGYAARCLMLNMFLRRKK